MAGDAHVAAVSGEQRGEDLDGGRLAGAVGAEQREDRALGDVQVDPFEDRLVAKDLRSPTADSAAGVGCWCMPSGSDIDAALRSSRTTHVGALPLLSRLSHVRAARFADQGVSVR
jgi:hypothetical protein